jgi:hypothetical protein
MTRGLVPNSTPKPIGVAAVKLLYDPAVALIGSGSPLRGVRDDIKGYDPDSYLSHGALEPRSDSIGTEGL